MRRFKIFLFNTIRNKISSSTNMLLDSFEKLILFNNFFGSYNQYLYGLAKRYILFVQGENNPDKDINGEKWFLNKFIDESIKIVFDVGANIGEWSTALLLCNSKVNIHCFEPDESAFNKLKTKRELKNAIFNNISIDSGLGNRKMRFHNKYSTWTSFHRNPLTEKNDSTLKEVKILSLDYYCLKNKINSIDFLKIDTEGNDFRVLLGAEKLISNNKIKFIQFEYGDSSKFARVFFYDFIVYLVKYNFEVYKILPKSLQKITYNPDMEKCSYANFIAVNKKGAQWFQFKNKLDKLKNS